MTVPQKTVLFFPLNSPGHVNSSLGVADVLREDHGYRTIFLLLGPMVGTCIKDHGHELIILDETKVHQDYEIENGEDPSDLDEEEKIKAGKSKINFPGFKKWPQIIRRTQHILKQSPLDALINSFELMDKLMVAELIDNYDNYVAAIDKIKPDLVIVDAYYIPPCIVNLKDIPWVRLFSANPLQMTKSKLPNGLKPPAFLGFSLLDKAARERMRTEDPERYNNMLGEWKSASDKIVQALSSALLSQVDFYNQHGCEPLAPGQMGHDSPHLNLYMYPKAIDYDQDDDLFEYPPRWLRCDSLVRRSTSQYTPKLARMWTEKLEAGMKNKKEIVFFSLGSIASGMVSIMKRFISYLATDTERLYVVSKGVNGDMYELDENNMIGGNYIPQTLILERADLAIIHGGNNSITECLYYGVPMVVLPVFSDQLDNAQRVEDLGLGKRLDVFTSTADDLRKAVDCVLSDRGLVERISGLGKKMRATKDSNKISLIIKKLIEQKTVSQSFIDYCRNKNYDEIQAEHFNS